MISCSLVLHLLAHEPSDSPNATNRTPDSAGRSSHRATEPPNYRTTGLRPIQRAAPSADRQPSPVSPLDRRKQTYTPHDERGGRKRRSIERARVEEPCGQEPGGERGDSHAHCEARRGQDGRAPHEQPQRSAAARAECHADADFGRPLSDPACDDGEQAHGGERHGDDRERAYQRRRESPLRRPRGSW
jgi:hypothetical protein